MASIYYDSNGAAGGAQPSHDTNPLYTRVPPMTQQPAVAYTALARPQQAYIPLTILQDSPALADCPVCGRRAYTRTKKVRGHWSKYVAATMCLVGGGPCLAAIPFFHKSFWDVCHFCDSCEAHIATWHCSGRTEWHYSGTTELHYSGTTEELISSSGGAPVPSGDSKTKIA